MNPPLIFITSHKMQRLAWICTLPPLDAVLTMRFTKKHATRLVQSAAPATQNDYGSLQSAAPATKNAPRLLKTMRKYCPYHTERLPTRCETCWNVTKCHACHTKQGYATFETSKSDYFCSTTPNENPSLHIREKCFLGRYRYQPTKYAVVVVKLLQSDEMYPKVSDNTSGENPWTNGVHRILSGRLIRIKKHLQCEAEVVGSCATRQKKTSGWSLQGRKSSVFHKDLLSPSERK